MSDRKLSDDIHEWMMCWIAPLDKFNACGAIATFRDRAAALETDVADLRARAALADKLTADEPDSEIADAVKILEGVFDSIRPVEEHERAALNRLVNRASGVTVKRLQEELAEARTQALGVTGDALPERRQVKP